MKGLLSFYSWRYPITLVYMLQSVEYRPGPYLAWFWRVQNFNKVMQRRSLDRTRAAQMLLLVVTLGVLMQVAIGIALLLWWYFGFTLQLFGHSWTHVWGDWRLGAFLVASYPLTIAHLVAIPLLLGDWFVVRPAQQRTIRRSERLFKNHGGIKLAVAGSYGKTTMKEILLTVLSAGKKVAATPANKNVPTSHAQFADRLSGREDIVIIEYGEGQPGDVGRLARQTHPTHAVITGIAPAHLDRYKTLARAAKDIFSVADYVAPKQVYVNVDSSDAKPYVTKRMRGYDSRNAIGWKVSAVKVSMEGTKFTLSKKTTTEEAPSKSKTKKASAKTKKPKTTMHKLQLTSKLLGRHQVGPLAFAAAFALEQGMTDEQVAAGVAATAPFEHRMQPYVMNGAWIIDDTYNGNLEGVRAGTQLLHELPARRKWYVTPGLVDQGNDTTRVHRHMGELIAAAKPDTVVLIANSVTSYIQAGLRAGGFEGELYVESNPLHFYTNLQYFVAAGDLVLMQNDWTDNYA